MKNAPICPFCNQTNSAPYETATQASRCVLAMRSARERLAAPPIPATPKGME